MAAENKSPWICCDLTSSNMYCTESHTWTCTTCYIIHVLYACIISEVLLLQFSACIYFSSLDKLSQSDLSNSNKKKCFLYNRWFLASFFFLGRSASLWPDDSVRGENKNEEARQRVILRCLLLQKNKDSLKNAIGRLCCTTVVGTPAQRRQSRNLF